MFDDLLSAFGQDTTTSRYDSWPDLLDYCRRSANPIGRLVLRAIVESGRAAYLIDGGLSQQGLQPGRLARVLADSGTVAVVGLPSAAAEVRRQARELHAVARLDFHDVDVPDGESPEDTAARVLEALAG